MCNSVKMIRHRQIQRMAVSRLSYLLILAVVSPISRIEPAFALETNTCIDVLSERHNPNADIILGFFETVRGSSSDTSLCDLSAVRSDQTYGAAKIIVDHPPSTVRLPNITIGLELYDDCEAPPLVTQAAVRYAASQSACGTGLRPGVIAPTLDSSDSAAASVLRAANVPTISLSAASVKDDTSSNILQMLPSASKQAKVLLDLVEYFGWSYLSIVATRGQYTEDGATETRRLAREKGICTGETLLLDASEMIVVAYEDVLASLLSNSDARGVVLWCSPSNLDGLLEAIKWAGGEALDLILLTSDNTLSDVKVLDAYPKAARGLIGLRPFDSSNPAPLSYLRQFSNESFDNLYSIPVTNAVLAFQHALTDIHQDLCGGLPGVCSQMAQLSAQEMNDALARTAFTGINDREAITFGDSREPSTYTYEIVQYQNDSANVSAYSLQQVGVWKPRSGLVLMGSFLHYTRSGLADSPLSSACGSLCETCLRASRPSIPLQNGGDFPENRGDQYMRIPGDLDIPVILSLSKPGWFGNNGLLCGHVREKEVLSAEAILFALDNINADPEVFPGVKLGVTVMDSCSQSVIATRQLAGVLGHTAMLEPSGPTLGVLGPDTDDVAMKVVDDITGPSGLVTISHGNNPSAQRSSNFFQTTPSLDDQVRAIATLMVDKLDWYFAGVIYSNTSYGLTGHEAFLKAAREFGICLGPVKHIPQNAVQPDFDAILADMYVTKGLNVIVTFVDESDARRLLVTARLYKYNRFTWVGTETWITDPTLFSGFEQEALGTLIVAPTNGDLTEFQRYLSDVPVQNATLRNPWLAPALDRISRCGNITEQQMQGGYTENQECVDLSSSGLDTLITLGDFNTDIVHVINALYSLVYGAEQIRQIKCQGESELLCVEFLEAVRSEEIYESVSKASFVNTFTAGERFTFKNKFGPGVFTVQQFQEDAGPEKKFTLKKVGAWTTGNMTLDSAMLKLSNPAAEGPQRDPLRCKPCFGEADDMKQEILDWELEGIWVTIILAASAVNLFLIFCTFCAFLINHTDPVVTTSSLSLSLWLLLGLAMMYCMNLAYLMHANTTICAIRRVGTALAYAVTYSALSVKSIRLNRLVRRKPESSKSFTGSWSQTLLFCVFLSAQVCVSIAWLLLQEPRVNVTSGVASICKKQDSFWSCEYTPTELVISLAYVYALVLFTFFTSMGAVKFPYFLNEGKFIFVSSLGSIVSLVGWTSVYMLTDKSIAIPAVCIGLTTNATIILAAMFLPKCGSLGKPVKNGVQNLDHKPEANENHNQGLVNDRDETTDF